MARQREEGYTQIDNSTLEKISKAKLNGTQFRIIMIVWRYTYGFQRKEHDLSLSFISNATGCDKRQVQRELKSLEDKNIITQNIKSGSYRKVSFNKNCSSWVIDGKSTNGKSTNGKSTNGEIDNTSNGESTNATNGKSTNQERKNLKKALKKNVENKKENSPYKEIIDYLNNKASTKYRHTTKATQQHINARLNEGFSADDFKTVIDVKCNDWLNNKEFRQYLRPQTLFGTKFESYLNQRIEPSNKTITYESHSLDDYVIPEPKETIFD